MSGHGQLLVCARSGNSGGKSRYKLSRARSGNGSLKLSQVVYWRRTLFIWKDCLRGVYSGFVFGYNYFFFLSFWFNRGGGLGRLVFRNCYLGGWVSLMTKKKLYDHLYSVSIL